MAQQFVKAKLKGDRVVLFIKPSCPYCTMAENVLSKYKFKPGHLESVDISGRSDMDSLQDYFQELTGSRTVLHTLPASGFFSGSLRLLLQDQFGTNKKQKVPRVFIGEECVGGGSDVSALHNSGELEGMLQSIGALQ